MLSPQRVAINGAIICRGFEPGLSRSRVRHSTAEPRRLRGSSSFAVPSVVMISRPCCTSYQSSPFIAISCVPRHSLHAFSHPFCDVATVCRIWSSTPSLPAHFPLDHALHQLAPAVSHCVSKVGELATYNIS